MKLSIITPVLNEPRVVRALDSIISQQHEHEVELIVVDGGSTDGTLDMLETRRNRIAVLVSEPDNGIYDGMNKGIDKATGDVIGILNADDQYSDSLVIRDVLQAFSDPKIDACYGNMVYVDQSGDVIRYWKAGPPQRANWYFGWAPPHPTFFVRRYIYEKYGTFNPEFPVAADYELMLRFIFKYEINTQYLDRILVNMAPEGNANSSILKVLKAKPELSRAWKYNHLTGGLFVPILRLARRPFQFIRRP